ncbi:hypothetical protein [Mycolicibacterium llatzerense]|uniref:hypothetical protein n=1 Tax=Mycolicibacterium llatzerense TaxID=280871 RepID=UPI0021B527D7|nr:hypothetical protein [Mycolicibacterium llatzerense]MCT7373362.1 hypothetical protein [Mycolicibacterium llatzerense]
MNPTDTSDTATSSGPSYDGGTRWSVRWNEVGTPSHIEEIGPEAQARAFHGALSKGYARMGRTDRPELVSAHIVWHAAPNPDEPATENSTQHDKERKPL